MREPYLGQERFGWSEAYLENITEVYTEFGWIRKAHQFHVELRHATLEQIVDQLNTLGYIITLEKK